VIVADTSFLYALLDGRDRRHSDAVAWYEHVLPELSTTPLALAEIDHLAAARAGERARAAFRRDVADGAYAIEWWPSAASECVAIAASYGELGLDLTDASLVALAGRLDTVTIATFDERHFRAARPLRGGPSFVLAPLDTPLP
jgi:predicted nucleic acid-binding protein